MINIHWTEAWQKDQMKSFAIIMGHISRDIMYMSCAVWDGAE